MISSGILFAIGALVCWGFGCFFIQRTARYTGIVKTLFYVGTVGTVLILPFLKPADLAWLFNPAALIVFGLATAIVIFTSLADFEALKRGKITVVEPIVGFELPLTIILAVLLWGEGLSHWQIILIGVTFIGLLFTIMETFEIKHARRILERGATIAGITSIFMAFNNLIIGIASQKTTPIITIWFTNFAVAAICGSYLIMTHQFKTVRRDLKKHWRLIIIQASLETLAWLCFAQATTRVPISIATAISECYIALAVSLGLFVSRERFKPHQMIGVVVILVSIITLSAITP